MKTRKIKLYVNDEAEKYFQRAFGISRKLMNRAIIETIEYRKVHHERPGSYYIDGILRQMIKDQPDSGFRWIAENMVSSQIIQPITAKVYLAFKAAVKANGRGANAHLKRRDDPQQSFTVSCSPSSMFKIEGEMTFSISGSKKDGRIMCRTAESLTFLKDADLKQYTISRQAGEYYLCINYEKPNHDSKPELKGKLGQDLGVVKSVCSYDGQDFSEYSFNTKRSMKYDRLAKKSNSKLANMTRGSNRYNKELLKMQKRAAKAARIRKEEVEKATTYIANTYEEVMIDKFSFKSAVKVASGEKAYRCMKYMYCKRLEDKAAKTGCKISYVQHQKGIKTTHKCSDCGSEHVHLNSKRQFHCLDCGYTDDRDRNAARNAYNIIA